jgi:hypothetical protein
MYARAESDKRTENHAAENCLLRKANAQISVEPSAQNCMKQTARGTKTNMAREKKSSKQTKKKTT